MEKKLILVFAFLLGGFATLGSSFVEYSHRCTTTPGADECNPSKPYTCSGSPLTCICSDDDEMYHFNNTCVVYADTTTDLCQTHVSTVKQIFCTPNARCIQELINQPGKCHCIDGYLTDRHLCKLGVDKTCTENDDCASTTAFLHCGRNSTCQCEENYTWNVPTERCLGLIGGTCVPTDQTTRPCSAGTMTCNAVTNVCDCLSPHIPSTEGKCFVNFNGTCSPDLQCHPDFPTCDAGNTCKCLPSHEYREGECLILVGGQCNLENNSAKCNTYSHCNETEAPNKCLCNTNYISDGTGYCKGQLNAVCSNTTQDCHTPFNLECHNVTSLCVCKEGFKDDGNGRCLADYNSPCHNDNNPCHPDFPLCKPDGADPPVNKCACEDDKRYDEQSSQCGITFGNQCDPNNDLCFMYSDCVNSVCECEQGYSQMGDICKGLHGSSCRNLTANNDCHENDFLQCGADLTCTCKDDYEYQTGDGSCKGRLDAPCEADTDCQTGHCSTGEQRKCACSGRKVHANGVCESVYNESCDAGCHRPYNLICSPEFNNCTCAEGKFHVAGDPIRDDRCVSGSGGPCSGNAADCVLSAHCSGSMVCECDQGFGNRDGLCVSGGTAVQSTAFFTILSFAVAIFNFKM